MPAAFRRAISELNRRGSRTVEAAPKTKQRVVRFESGSPKLGRRSLASPSGEGEGPCRVQLARYAPNFSWKKSRIAAHERLSVFSL